MQNATTLPVAEAIRRLREELRLSYGHEFEFEVRAAGEVIGACSESAGDVLPEVEAAGAVRSPYVELPSRSFADSLFLASV